MKAKAQPSERSGERLSEALARRVWVQGLRPSVDGGAFPVKRTVGESVEVAADVFADGHDKPAAVLCWRRAGEAAWREERMRPEPNDVWRASFSLEVQQPHEFTVLGWVDHFATWRDGLEKKHAAGQDVASELLEGAALVAAAARRAGSPDGEWLAAMAARLDGEAPQAERVELALRAELGSRMLRHDPRERATEGPVQPVEVARERARFSTWYELFPRSTAADGALSGTLGDAERELGRIARMGFDVLYLPPIHPIGRVNRKGRNNTLEPSPADPGSPWAIGAAEGGHTTIHPDLGTLEDFRRFVRAAGGQGLEVALDLAFQCAPDHPWVREHPQWFRRRPDGTIKHAENPPKKYEDIYPLNFDTEDWRALWTALRDLVLFWIEQGVRIFRVDNPHTKPLRFWGWLIGEVKRRDPDAIFLSEAFTRPKVMYTLAKVGFDQSYTYFTWRNTKQELIDYFTELTRTELLEYFRPHLWPNTPDILPEFLQWGGRPAFQCRLVLAATLGASYGIYSGYELCENLALPGREEYQDSEKYEIKRRDWTRAGNIVDWITRVNRIRRENPALAFDRRLRFHACDNEHLLAYSKATADLSNIVLVVVNLDPHNAHDGWVELPLEEWGLETRAGFQVHDLIGEGRYIWHGARNYLSLDPAVAPAHVFRLRRRVRSEHDFDYFM